MRLATRRTLRSALAVSVTVLVFAWVTGCTGRAPEPPAPGIVEGSRVVYTCPDDFRFAARFESDTVRLDLGDRALDLPAVPAASGSRFESDAVELWSRGGEASLRIGELRREGCRADVVQGPWEEARALGARFRAVGQEPGWLLDIDEERRIRYLGDYGATRIVFPTAARRTGEGDLARYEATVAGHHLVAEVTREPCQDVMSGEPFSHRAAIRVDGVSLEGCGRALPADEIGGTTWELVQLADAPARRSGADPPYLRLDAEGRATGSTGCNVLTGSVILQGDRLRFGPIATTRRACLDSDLATQEQAFLAALASTTEFRVEGETLTLLAGGRPIARFAAGAPR